MQSIWNCYTVRFLTLNFLIFEKIHNWKQRNENIFSYDNFFTKENTIEKWIAKAFGEDIRLKKK